MESLLALPLLSLLIGLPCVAASLLWLLPPRHARSLAVAAAVMELLLACVVVGSIHPEQPGFQRLEQAVWIPTVHVQYLLGVDGLSALFLPLSALLFLGILLSAGRQHLLPRLYFALLLLLEGISIGIYCALDTLLFFLFWELTLIPLYFLITVWGIGPQRRFAANQYTLWMLTGGVALLFGFLLLAMGHADLQVESGGAMLPAALVFDLPTLLATPLSVDRQWPIFLLLLIGFAVKTPVIFLHTWLPTLAMEGPVAVLAVMTGLKLGGYGLLRFALPLAPQVAQACYWLLAGLGVVGIVYGGLAALAQTNLRRLLAFSSIHHVGLVLLGFSTFTLQGVQGAVLQLLNFTMVAGGLFLITGFIRQRTVSTELVHLGGLVRSMPFASTFLLFFGLAGMGLPLTSGFPAEQLLLLGVFSTYKGAALLAMGGQILGAGYFLHYYRRAFLGPVTHRVVAEAEDLRPRERWVVLLFALPLLLSGIYPRWVLHFIQAPTTAWLAHFSGGGP